MHPASCRLGGLRLSVGGVSILFVIVNVPQSPVMADPEGTRVLLDEFAAAARARREADLRLARVLTRLARTHGWESVGCASAAELGERHALPGPEVRGLLDLGRVIAEDQVLEREVETGKIPVAAAACVSKVLAEPAFLRDDDDWIGWARYQSISALRHRVRRRLEEARCGNTPVVEVTVCVQPKARDEFGRARVVASRREKRSLTTGETFELVVGHYLDSFDELRTDPGARRTPPTSMVAGRYVPMAVRREIYERQGQRCAVPLCDHVVFLEMAHLVAHVSGGDREADNLVLLCSRHHRQFDAGEIRLSGSAASPQFQDFSGHPLSRTSPPPDASQADRVSEPMTMRWSRCAPRGSLPARATETHSGAAPPIEQG